MRNKPTDGLVLVLLWRIDLAKLVAVYYPAMVFWFERQGSIYLCQLS